MKRFEFVTWARGGNLYPALGIGVELAKRGHSICFLGEESQRSRIEQAGIQFSPYARMTRGSLEPPAPEDRLGHLIDDV
jgi:UDP:flavonoid glycosyltransferase YjiC (YdhE family)